MCAVLKTSKKNQKNPMCAVFSLFFKCLCFRKNWNGFSVQWSYKRNCWASKKKDAFSPFKVWTDERSHRLSKTTSQSTKWLCFVKESLLWSTTRTPDQDLVRECVAWNSIQSMFSSQTTIQKSHKECTWTSDCQTTCPIYILKTNGNT